MKQSVLDQIIIDLSNYCEGDFSERMVLSFLTVNKIKMEEHEIINLIDKATTKYITVALDASREAIRRARFKDPDYPTAKELGIELNEVYTLMFTSKEVRVIGTTTIGGTRNSIAVRDIVPDYAPDWMKLSYYVPAHALVTVLNPEPIKTKKQLS